MPTAVDDLLAEAKRRQGEAETQRRQNHYERSRAAYFNENEGGGEGGIEAMDSAGRVTLRATGIRSTLQRRTGKVNLLTPIADDYTYLRGVLPNVKVLPEAEDEDAKKTAIQRTRIVRAQFENSAMESRQIEAAWYLTTLGDCLYTLTPVFPEAEEPFRPVGIYISVVDPALAYPRFRTGISRDQLDDVYVIHRISREQALAEYDLDTTKKEVEVIHYYGRSENILLVDQEERSRVEHGLGFCPAEWARNKLVGGKFAQSDILGVIEQHNELQVMTEVLKDAIIESTYAQLLIKDPVNVSEQFEVGPGAAPIVVQATGDARRIPPAPPPQAAELILDRQWQNIQHQTGSAPIRTEGRIGGSNISARAINQAQGPMETRLAGWQLVMGQTLQRLAGKMLLMFHSIREFQAMDAISIWGSEAGKPYNVSFRSEELNGWWRCAVNYGAMIGSSNHEKAVVGLQLMGQSLVPGEWVLEQIGVDDPETLLKEAEAQSLRRMQIAQGGQPGAQPGGAPPGGGSPDQQQQQIMQPAEQGQAMAAGATNPESAGAGAGNGAVQSPPGPPPGGGAPTMPNFPVLAGSPIEQAQAATPETPLLQRVSAALMAVAPVLQGHVLRAVPDARGVLHVTVTVWADTYRLREAFKAQNLKASFELNSKRKNPINVPV